MSDTMPSVTLIGGPLDGQCLTLRDDQRKGFDVPIYVEGVVKFGHYVPSLIPAGRGKMFWVEPARE